MRIDWTVVMSVLFAMLIAYVVYPYLPKARKFGQNAIYSAPVNTQSRVSSSGDPVTDYLNNL